MSTTLAEYLADLKSDLARVREQIVKAEKQQDYSADDGQGKIAVKRGDLQTLYDKEERLKFEILDLENGSSSPVLVRPL